MMPDGDRNDEMIELLGEGVDYPIPYTALFGPLVGDRGGRVLTNLGIVATRLRDDVPLWRALIRHRNWRYAIVGCSAALLVRDDRFLDDLVYRFREGSGVSPQLAVALGIIHPIEAVAEFEPLLGEAAGSIDPKSLFSAYAVLKLLGRGATEAFEAGDLFRRSRDEPLGTSWLAYDASIALGAVEGLWAFWKATSLSTVPGPDPARVIHS
jgi:hypothetical protein